MVVTATMVQLKGRNTSLEDEARSMRQEISVLEARRARDEDMNRDLMAAAQQAHASLRERVHELQAELAVQTELASRAVSLPPAQYVPPAHLRAPSPAPEASNSPYRGSQPHSPPGSPPTGSLTYAQQRRLHKGSAGACPQPSPSQHQIEYSPARSPSPSRYSESPFQGAEPVHRGQYSANTRSPQPQFNEKAGVVGSYNGSYNGLYEPAVQHNRREDNRAASPLQMESLEQPHPGSHSTSQLWPREEGTPSAGRRGEQRQVAWMEGHQRGDNNRPNASLTLHSRHSGMPPPQAVQRMVSSAPMPESAEDVRRRRIAERQQQWLMQADADLAAGGGHSPMKSPTKSPQWMQQAQWRG